MILIAVFLFKNRNIGLEILAINMKSPDAEKRPELVAKHKKLGIALTVATFLGLIGGIVGVIYFLNVPQPFVRTYGHGFIGTLILSFLIVNIFIGGLIKKAKREKGIKRLKSFHFAIFYVVAVFIALSAITGAIVLISGPAALN
jgi:hypothetical protein